MAIALATYIRPQVGSNYYFDFDALNSITEVSCSNFDNYSVLMSTQNLLQVFFDLLNSFTSTNCFYEVESQSVLFSDKIGSVQSFYGFSKSDICKICEISRPTLYSWLENKTVPEKKNIHKINMLYDIYKDNYANKMKSLFHGYNKEIIAYLMGKNVTEEGLKKKIADAIAKTQQRTARIIERRNSEYNKNVPILQQEDILETNLIISE